MSILALSASPPWAPLAFLFGAIALFKLSTLQGRWPVRLAMWLLGAAALGGAAGVSIANRENYGVWRAVGDLADHWRDPTESLVWRAVTQNQETLPDYSGPIIDFGIFVVGLIGLLCLMAFTPGKKLEQTARALFIGVIGMVIGAFLTVGVVALGFGGEAHRAVIVGSATKGGDVTVLDGDTIKIGATSIRLWGLDTPESGQRCGRGQNLCGDLATAHLGEIIAGHLVECRAEQTRGRSLRASFGRPLMRCIAVQGDGARFDLAERMLQDGYAALYYPDRGNEPAEVSYQVYEGRFALGCTLRPDWWRHAPTRTAMLGGETVPRERLIGCG